MPVIAKTICVDGHLHLYPCYRPELAFRCLVDNLIRLARSSATLYSLPVFHMALLAEGQACHFFRDALKGHQPETAGAYLIRPGPEPGSLLVSQENKPDLCLLAGRQIVTAERIEILALTADLDIPDGLPAQTVLDTIEAQGGVPVLSWAPGKWFLDRGKLVRRLIESARPGGLLLSDTPLRPTSWGEPRLIRLGRTRGLGIIAGSDPLPFAGEERGMGSYGLCRQGEFDTSRPVTELRAILGDPTAGIALIGRRNATLTAVRRFLAARRAKAG